MDRAYRFLKAKKAYEKKDSLIKKLKKNEEKNKKELKKYDNFYANEHSRRWDMLEELRHWFDLGTFIDDSAQYGYYNMFKFNDQVYAQCACNIIEYIDSCNKYMSFFLDNRYSFSNSMNISSIIVYEEINKGNYDVFEMPLKKMKERYGAYKIVEKSLEECRKIKNDSVSRFELAVEVARRQNRECQQLHALYDISIDNSIKIDDPIYDINNIKKHIIFDYEYAIINYDEAISFMNYFNIFVESINKLDLSQKEKDAIYNNLYSDMLNDKIKIEEETDKTLFEKYKNKTETRRLGVS